MTQSNLLFTILPSKLKTCDSLVQVRGKATQGGLFDLCLFAFYFRVTQTPGYFKLKLVLYKCNMQNVFSIEISLENCAKIQSGSLLPQLERHPHQSSVLKVTLLELKKYMEIAANRNARHTHHLWEKTNVSDVASPILRCVPSPPCTYAMTKSPKRTEIEREK